MELCVRVRRDARLGRSARAVLRVADEDRVKAMLSQARAQEAPQIPRWHRAASGDLVAGYRRGDHECVWRELRAHELDDPCNLDLAPDCLHKANISGRAPYGIELPYLGADPVFVHEEHGLAFVDYLRLAFRWGGFPRLERHAHDADVRKFVVDMTRETEPF
jgi:hypothetical protein